MHSPETTFTVQNVAAVMEKVPVDSRRQVWLQLLQRDTVEETFARHSNNSDVLQSCCDTYTNCKPDSCWEELASCLYEEDKVTAVDRTRPFLPPRGEYIVNLYSVYCMHWEKLSTPRYNRLYLASYGLSKNLLLQYTLRD